MQVSISCPSVNDGKPDPPVRDRIRKVKCDERKPSCSRCSKTGRKCDGYLDPKASGSRRRLKDQGHHHRLHALGPSLGLLSPEEERAFGFFQHVTGPCLSGDSDASFWGTFVMQLCQTEPAVRHAVLAISSFHESFSQGQNTTDISGSQSFALQHYNTAITCLLDPMKDAVNKPLASLITCVIFVCIEFMQAKDREALIHLEQGRQIVSRLDRRASSNSPEMESIRRHVVPLYTRLSLISFLFGGNQSFRSHRDIPDNFETMDELRYCLQNLADQALRFARRSHPAKNSSDNVPREAMRQLEVEQNYLLSQLAKLSVAFSLFRASRSKNHTQHSLLVLEMYLHAQHIWISTALSSSEVVYDDYLSSFAAIVPLASAYLDQGPLSSQYHEPQAGNSTTFETHVIPPLYYVAVKCRHPLLRRSALDLLRRAPTRRENLWQASVTGAIAGHIIEVEERWPQGRPCPMPGASHLSLGEVSATGFDAEHFDHDAAIDALFAMHMATTPSCCLPDDNAHPSTAISAPIPDPNATDLDFYLAVHAPVEPTFAMAAAAEIASPRNRAPSSPGALPRHNTATEPLAGFLAPLNYQETQPWQQQQQDHQLHSSSPLGFTDAAAIYQLDDTGRAAAADPAVASPSSGYESPDSDEYFPPSAPFHAGAGAPSAQDQSPTPSRVALDNTEAPFGLPEELRVHDAAIEGGVCSRLAVFRMLHGADADWNDETV